ncbi:hypothetical protein Clacol_005502 [Clathrus columnatus]|uniref:protein-tyrosine-phosphatase n=1 Tax=Clathrus columnatus TaxID=1419009 RepID=A0AAV5AEE8_9AGAM|nr:hypothetical protein Clacol_005502 [Clathrus columnatus]
MLGRPPTQTFAGFQWLFPSLERPVDTLETGRHWAARFMRDCTSEVLQTVLGIKPVTYASILRLDKKIRDYPEMEVPDNDQTHVEDVGFGRKIQRSFLGIVREVTSLFLHRRCFALALRDHPEDPLRSPFGPSVLACYRSATKFIDKLSSVNHSDMSYRVWFLWPNAFIATVILGSIVARSPGCSLAASAFLELEKAASLWEKAPDYVCRPRVKSKLEHLKQKACMAFAQHHARRDPLNTTPSGVEVSDEIIELGGGCSRIISHKGVEISRDIGDNNTTANSILSSQISPPVDLVNLSPSTVTTACPSDSPFATPSSSNAVLHSINQNYPNLPLQQSYLGSSVEGSDTLSPFNSRTPPLAYTNNPGELSGYQSPLEFPSPSQLPQYFNDVFGALGSPMNGDIAMTAEEDILKRLCLVSETWQTTMDTNYNRAFASGKHLEPKTTSRELGLAPQWCAIGIEWRQIWGDFECIKTGSDPELWRGEDFLHFMPKRQKPQTGGGVAGSDSVSLILPQGLYLGPCSAASSQSFLKNNLISDVLSVGATPARMIEGVTYHRLSLNDDTSSPITKVVNSACQIIDGVLKSKKGKGKILVHCSAGISRSPTLVTAYLMKVHGMSLRSALGHVIRARNQVLPNPGFIEQLKELEMELFGTQSLDVEGLPTKKEDRLALFDTVVVDDEPLDVSEKDAT